MIKKTIFLILACFCCSISKVSFAEIQASNKNSLNERTLITDEQAFAIKKKSEHIPFSVQDRNNKLIGIIHKPINYTANATSSLPVVIICHGLKDNKYGKRGAFVRLSQKLAESGFVVVRFDFQGCGDSEGIWSHNLISDFDRNFDCVLKYVLDLPFVNPDKVGVFGHSLGAHTAIVAANKHPCIKTIILWAPVSNGCLWGYDFFTNSNATEVNSEIIASSLSLPADADVSFFRHTFSAEFLYIEDAAILKKLSPHFSVFHLHGEKDPITPIHHQTVFRYENRNSSRKIKYLLLENSLHSLSDSTVLKETENEVIDWLQEELY